MMKLQLLKNESKTTTTSKTTATQSRQNFGFEFLRCIKLSWVIKDSDSIPEGNLHKFCLKSSFFTNGMRLHALCGKKLLCWSLKKGVVKMAEDTFRQVVPGEAISFSEIHPNCKWNSPQCQVTKEDGHTNGHTVPVCFDRVNNCLWSVDISAKTRISFRRWANLHPTQQWFGGLVPQEDDPSIMLHEFTKNRSRSSFKMTNNLGSALILAGLDSLQSPLRPPTYGALENSEYLISLNAPSLVSTTPETLEAFANLLENNVKSLNKNILSSSNAARDNAIAESYLLSACRLLHTCIFKLMSDQEIPVDTETRRKYSGSRQRLLQTLQLLAGEIKFSSSIGLYIRNVAVRCIAIGSDFFFDTPLMLLHHLRDTLKLLDPVDVCNTAANGGLLILLRNVEDPPS